MDGYVLLLGCAQRQFQESVKFFEEYWLDANLAIQRDLAGRLEYFDNDLQVSTAIGIASVNYHSDSIASCFAQVLFTAKIKHQSPIGLRGRRQYQVGQVQFQLEFELGKVGEAWYVATPRWDRAVVKVGVDRTGKWC